MGNRGGRIPRRRAAMAGFAGLCLAVAAGSMAWACTVIQGNTWYSDGSSAKSGPVGTTITAFATGARASKQFKLVIGTNTSPGHEDHACMDQPTPVNPNIRTSSSSGFISNTSGPIPSVGPGDWQVCFGELPLDGNHSATNPVFFTVI